MAKKKSGFFDCDGCMGIYAVNTGFTAPKNKYKLKKVCKSCYKQYIGKNPPLPAAAAPALKAKFGGFLNQAHGSVNVNNNAGILSNANAALLNKAPMVAAGGGNMVAAGGGNMVAAGGGNLVGNDGAS